MAFDFPAPATEGQLFTPSGGPTYIFTSGKWNVKASNDLTLSGTGTFGDLAVTDDATIADTLNVTGTATFGNATFSNVTVTASLTPSANGTINLGSAALRWATIYTSDLNLKNEHGDWTIVEGADDLFITNNRTGKRYKFLLEEA